MDVAEGPPSVDVKDNIGGVGVPKMDEKIEFSDSEILDSEKEIEFEERMESEDRIDVAPVSCVVGEMDVFEIVNVFLVVVVGLWEVVGRGLSVDGLIQKNVLDMENMYLEYALMVVVRVCVEVVKNVVEDGGATGPEQSSPTGQHP